MLRTHAAYRIACGLALAVSAASSRGQIVPTGFAVEPVVLEPLAAHPVAFVFLPDGRVLLTEKDTGNIRIATSASTTSVVVATVPDLTNQIEQGLLGIAIDPDWPARPYVYVLASHTDTRLHVTRYTAAGDLTDPASTSLSLAQPFVVLDDLPDLVAHHNGGTLRFGPDAMLYVSLGDDGNACGAQDLGRLAGKILRLDIARLPGTGTGPPPKSDITPPDNPFAGPDDNARLVFAYGLRNPFRFTIDATTGDLYIGDVGLTSWEEVDELVRGAGDGANFGWPAFEGPMPDPCCSECTSVPPFTAPIYAYPNPPDPLAASVVAGPVYRGGTGPVTFPAEYEGDLFVADFFGRWIRRLENTGGDWQLAPPVPGQPNSSDWASNLGKPSDVQVGPDGALYCMIWPHTTLPRGLWRIVRTPATDARAARIPLHLVPNPAVIGEGVRLAGAREVPAGVTLRIFDVTGRPVRTLPLAGDGGWDGRRESGSPAPPGVYFYEVRSADARLHAGRLTLVR